MLTSVRPRLHPHAPRLHASTPIAQPLLMSFLRPSQANAVGGNWAPGDEGKVYPGIVVRTNLTLGLSSSPSSPAPVPTPLRILHPRTCQGNSLSGCFEFSALPMPVEDLEDDRIQGERMSLMSSSQLGLAGNSPLHSFMRRRSLGKELTLPTYACLIWRQAPRQRSTFRLSGGRSWRGRSR